MNAQDEAVIARIRPHSRALILPTVLLVAIAAVVGFLGSVLTEAWQLVTMAIVAGMALLFGWLAPLLRFAARNYTITTRRIIARSGIVVRESRELLLSSSYDVTVRKGPLQTLLGSGDVIVNAGHDATIVLWDVPSANLVRAALHDLMESNRALAV